MGLFTPSQEKLNKKLFEAVRKDDAAAVRAAIEDGGNPDTTASSDDALIFFALSEGYYEAFQGIVDGGANLKATTWYSGQSILEKVIVSSGSNVDRFAYYMLGSAADRLDFNHKTRDGFTALMKAYQCGKSKSLLDAIERKAGKMSDSEAEAVCLERLGHGDLKTLKLIEERGYTPRVKTMESHLSSFSTKLAVVKHLVEKMGLDVNAPGKAGNTPLMVAAENGCLEVVNYLLSKDADVMPVNKKGNSASHSAFTRLSKKRVACLSLFIDQMTDEQLARPVNRQNETLLTMAVRKDNQELVKKLLARGVDINQQGKAGLTPLHVAIEKDSFPMVQLLVKAGAKTSVVNEKGLTAKTVAQLKRNKKIVELVRENESHDDWVKTGDLEVAHTTAKAALGISITEVFNFKSQDRMTLVKNIKSDNYETMFRENFNQIANQNVIQEAAEELLNLDPNINQQELLQQVKKTKSVSLPNFGKVAE